MHVNFVRKFFKNLQL